jgi:phosphocarrier protein HPr
MIKKEVTIINKFGLHARPASKLVQMAAQSKAHLWLEKDGERINGKSILGVMMLAAEQGSKLILETSGEGAEELMQQLIELFQNKFYED